MNRAEKRKKLKEINMLNEVVTIIRIYSAFRVKVEFTFAFKALDFFQAFTIAK